MTARPKRTLLALIAAASLGVLALASLGPAGLLASSHREAPLVSGDPLVDTTDVWAFVSADEPDTVTLIASWLPFEEPAGGPNFYKFAPGVNYDINIENDGGASADITYRWVFKDHYRTKDTFLYNTGQVTSLTDPDLNFFQTYTLWEIRQGEAEVLARNRLVAPSNVGAASMPNYARLFNQAVYPVEGGTAKTFAGQSDDAFFLDLRVFDLLYGANLSEVGDDTLAGFNVQTIAFQVPKSDVAKGHRPGRNPIIGVWSSTSRRSTRVQTSQGTESFSGPFVQVSRLGAPLVNEVVIPLRDKDRFNASKPANDGQFLQYVQDPELPRLLNAIYGLPIPDSDPGTDGVQRADLIQVFLTGVPGLNQPADFNKPAEFMRLNMSIPPCEAGTCADYSRLGVIDGDLAGYPNGRRLADDVIDISLQVVEGELLGMANDLGDGVDANERAFRMHFPYVALPHSGSDTDPH